MQIDRERFFVFVGTLAAVGLAAVPACSTNATPPSAPVDPVDAPPAASSTPPLPTYVRPSATTPAASSEPPPATLISQRGNGKPPNPYEGTPVTAQSCDPALNKIGTSGNCSLNGIGPTCESLGDTKKECPKLNALLKPRVAEAANACLHRRSGTKDICEFNVTSICAYEALGSACRDPSAKAVCDKVIAHCGAPQGNYNKMTRESCEAGVSGIADSKRTKFISCITEACRFETCLTYL